MIENLLKQSFKKPSQPVLTSEKSSHSNLDLPVWLQCDSSMVPAQYKQLWTLVQSANEFADTQKVSQLLLTSSLHTDVLGYIWNLANKFVPGQLTKQEFYIVLALVGLAQTNCTFNNLSILNLIPSAPIPVLQVKIFEKALAKSNIPSNSPVNNFNEFQPVKKNSVFENNEIKGHNEEFFEYNSEKGNIHLFNDKKQDLPMKAESPKNLHSTDSNRGGHKNSHFPLIGLSPTAELELDDDFTDFQSVSVSQPEVANKPNPNSILVDEFTDFQSADVQQPDPLETVVITQKKEIPKIPLPKNLTGKLTNLKTSILKISPESERKLKILSQPESLSSLPESKISSSNKVSTMPGISVISSSSSRGIGSRLANHSLGKYQNWLMSN